VSLPKQPVSSKSNNDHGVFPQSLRRSNSNPRGLLQFYVLHLVSEGISNGYEIFQSMKGNKLEGWEPRAGSINMALRRLSEDGLVRETFRSANLSDRRTYVITPKGAEFLQEGKQVLANADRNWFNMRGIFIELMDATELPGFLSAGSKTNFQLTREIIKAKLPKLSNQEAESSLREYVLNLEMQLEWAKSKMQEFEKLNWSSYSGFKRRS
jgi:DNA-binding PadR family transcriptional regulator